MVHKFLPLIMSLMVDSGLNSLHDKLNDEDKNGGIEGPSQFTAYFVEITSSNSVAFTLAWCYLLHVIKQKDRYYFTFSCGQEELFHLKISGETVTIILLHP